MEIEKTAFEGLVVLHPRVFGDERGYFFESYHQKKFREATGQEVTFVQDNESLSRGNVLRGLHFQRPPYAQGKLIRVIRGEVLDVVLDIRKSSPTFGEHFSIRLSQENKTMLYVPPGFAHGFLTLCDDTVFFYKCTAHYNKDAEDAILWKDPQLGIDWGVSEPVVSTKDEQAKPFRELDSPFE